MLTAFHFKVDLVEALAGHSVVFYRNMEQVYIHTGFCRLLGIQSPLFIPTFITNPAAWPLCLNFSHQSRSATLL